MVFWIVCHETARAGGRARHFGPYESKVAAERALVGVRRRFLGTATCGFEVVLDYA